jgi:hypothetical protein
MLGACHIVKGSIWSECEWEATSVGNECIRVSWTRAPGSDLETVKMRESIKESVRKTDEQNWGLEGHLARIFICRKEVDTARSSLLSDGPTLWNVHCIQIIDSTFQTQR